MKSEQKSTSSMLLPAQRIGEATNKTHYLAISQLANTPIPHRNLKLGSLRPSHTPLTQNRLKRHLTQLILLAELCETSFYKSTKSFPRSNLVGRSDTATLIFPVVSPKLIFDKLWRLPCAPTKYTTKWYPQPIYLLSTPLSSEHEGHPWLATIHQQWQDRSALCPRSSDCNPGEL